MNHNEMIAMENTQTSKFRDIIQHITQLFLTIAVFGILAGLFMFGGHFMWSIGFAGVAILAILGIILALESSGKLIPGMCLLSSYLLWVFMFYDHRFPFTSNDDFEITHPILSLIFVLLVPFTFPLFFWLKFTIGDYFQNKRAIIIGCAKEKMDKILKYNHGPSAAANKLFSSKQIQNIMDWKREYPDRILSSLEQGNASIAPNTPDPKSWDGDNWRWFCEP